MKKILFGLVLIPMFIFGQHGIIDISKKNDTIYNTGLGIIDISKKYKISIIPPIPDIDYYQQLKDSLQASAVVWFNPLDTTTVSYVLRSGVFGYGKYIDTVYDVLDHAKYFYQTDTALMPFYDNNHFPQYKNKQYLISGPTYNYLNFDSVFAVTGIAVDLFHTNDILWSKWGSGTSFSYQIQMANDSLLRFICSNGSVQTYVNSYIPFMKKYYGLLETNYFYGSDTLFYAANNFCSYQEQGSKAKLTLSNNTINLRIGNQQRNNLSLDEGSVNQLFFFNKRLTRNQKDLIGMWYYSELRDYYVDTITVVDTAFTCSKLIENPVADWERVPDHDDLTIADPFVIKKGTKYYMFSEIVMPDYKKIALWSSDNGLYYKFDSVLNIIAPNAYPMVWLENGSYYMYICGFSGKLNKLYRTTYADFPIGWSLIKEDVMANTMVDGTIYKNPDDNMYYLMGKDNAIDSLRLFYKSTLTTGNWIEHPKSPISYDKKDCRNGGRIVKLNDRIFCPRQDISGVYGRYTRMFSIDTLTTTNYYEHEIASSPVLTDSDDPNTWNDIAMHHMDLGLVAGGENIVIVDANGTTHEWSIGIYKINR